MLAHAVERLGAAPVHAVGPARLQVARARLRAQRRRADKVEALAECSVTHPLDGRFGHAGGRGEHKYGHEGEELHDE